uniref:EscT/YscT/HrcT family type III secretion system export apparatus protein n=1 Tax=uncultured Thiotrichaceae bacterium TaxID=298394 RepID=A0A6S6U5X3_9GAMM|nr:MAG: EscT/YscT/HrcT family type III secretion system export apparatus protein [uncultured Thiotrichaceae bacterium]
MGELSSIQTWFLALILTAPRIMVTFSIMPMFAQTIFPALVRNGIMVVLSFTILPLTHSQLVNADLAPLSLLFIVLKEGAIGLVLGYAMSIPFWAMRGVGFIMDLQRGAMSALFFSPPASGMVSPLGNLLTQLATVLLFVSGGFLMLLETIMLSYQTWPLHQFMPDFNINSAKFFLKQLDLLFYTIVLVAGPFMGLMLIIDFGTGLVGRYLPQLNIFLIAMPIKSAMVFFMLIFYVVIIGHYLRDTFINFGSNLHILDGLING